MGGVCSALGFGRSKPRVEHDSFFKYAGKDANGEVVQFEKFRGKVVLVVNVASK